MSEHQSKLPAGKIQFHQWCEPPLEPGDYTMTTEQTVREFADEKASKPNYKTDFQFSVAGPRFSLDPSEIYSVYPPKGHIGDFSNSLPQIVFTRRTLPWERSLWAGHRQEGDKRPWMALLVFSADDFGGTFPEIKSRPVEELINPAADALFVGPKIDIGPDGKKVLGPDGKELPRGGLAAYEKPQDLCNTIELSSTLFQSVAPTTDDLAYLGHVREVNTGHKETLSFLADGWFSVVLANRLPKPELKGTEPPRAVENRAVLVSLEGMTDYLHGKSSVGKKNVRLAVLASWSFHCREAFAFKSSMKKLVVRRLCVPWDGPAPNGTPSGKESPEEQVRKAFKLGYTALNHSTRRGEKAVSWYRGPLVPLSLAKESKYTFRPAADAALRYSPLDGMMDVSYAAAFQLGRLLALQDRHFATSLFAYRNGVRQQINEVLGRKRIGKLLGGDGRAEGDIMSAYLRKAKGNGSGKVGDEKAWSALPPAFDPFKRKKVDEKSKKPGELKLTTDFDLTIPKSICQWLARLMLLYRVPFTNLVADERMLPPESMRFFYLDPGWLNCLLQGACSVGRSSSRDELVDEYLRDKFLDFSMEQALGVRTRPAEEGAEADAEPEKGDEDPERINVKRKPARLPEWPLTGFLLRSPVVEGWQGLEMRAWKDSGARAADALAPLRIDRLTPDIMLCIFNGKVNRIEVKQPPEGMHFGATVDGEEFNKYHLRALVDTTAPLVKANGTYRRAEPGDQIDRSPDDPPNKPSPPAVEPILLREGGVARVVKVSKLAKDLQDKLKLVGARDDAKEFTSAEFGVEMVESPGRVFFDVTNPDEDVS